MPTSTSAKARPGGSSEAVTGAHLHERVDNDKMERAAAMLKVLAHPKRMAIVDLLGRTDRMSVTDIFTELDMPQAIASQHLITLKDRGILDSQKSGTKIYYSLAVPALLEVIHCLEQGLAKHSLA